MTRLARMTLSPDVAALNPELATVTRKPGKQLEHGVGKQSPRQPKRLRDGPVPGSDCWGAARNHLLCPDCGAVFSCCVTDRKVAHFTFECGHVHRREIKR